VNGWRVQPLALRIAKLMVSLYFRLSYRDKMMFIGHFLTILVQKSSFSEQAKSNFQEKLGAPAPFMGGLLSVLLLGEPVTALHHSLCHHDHRLLDSSKIALLITFFKKNFLDFCLHTYIFSVSNCKSTRLQKFCIHFPYIPLHCFGLFCKQIRKQRHISGPSSVQLTYKNVQQTGLAGLNRQVSFTQNEPRL